MKNRRCALVAAVIVVVCAVAFWCWNGPSDGAEKSVSTEEPLASVQPASFAVAAVAPASVQPSSNQTATVRGTKPYVLACDAGFDKPLRLAAESLGARTVGVLSRKSLLVEADDAALSRLRADGRFSMADEFHPSDKIASRLAAEIAGGAKTVDVSFLTLSPADRRIVQDRIAARGGKVLGGCLNAGDSFSARVPAGLVAELASCGEVRWMERFDRPHLMNDYAVDAEAMNVRAIWRSDENPGGLSGTNQVVSTSDSGIDTGDPETLHEDLRAHILDMKASKTDAGEDCDMYDSNGHGTHTAGSIVGDGTLSQDAMSYTNGPIRGTAWAAKLCAWFCGKDGSRSVYTPESCAALFRGDEEGTAWSNAYIHSASWGSDTAGLYTVRCKAFDEYLWNHPDFLPVVSAGNAGEFGAATVGSPAAAKNVLAVGATVNRPKGDPSETATFSSRGACADGRIKPDIAAPGDAVTSTRSSMVAEDATPYTPYTSMSGTSMSCPLTAGSVALVREWLVDRMGYTNEAPSAALMKAVITGGAKGVPMPNNSQGWGRVDLAETLFPSGRAVKLMDRIPFIAGEELTWVVRTKSAAPLDVQLVWTDYPGDPSDSRQAEPQLVNDLDLTVRVGRDGDLLYGNGGSSPDTLNNLESVRIEKAAVNTYYISVSSERVMWDSEDGATAALYIRGAFDPDEIEPFWSVRIVRSPAETNSFTRLDMALAAARNGDTVEILEPTELRTGLTLTNAYALTVTATNANPRLTPVSRRNGADILVTNGSLFFTNVVFQTEATTPVRASEYGAVRVAGTAVFDDIVSGTPGILTDRPAGFVLAGLLQNGITVDCTGKSSAGDQFGVYSCADAVAVESAPRLISTYGEHRAGVAEKPDVLKWSDEVTVDPEVAVAYVRGDNPVYYRTLDQLFDKTNGNVVITKSGLRLEKPRTLTGKQFLSAEDGVGEIVIRPEGTAGFEIGAGCDLTVSGITFEDYTGNGLFVVNGADAKLTVTNSVFRDIEGTNRWSGAIAVLKGSASVCDSTNENCRATGRYMYRYPNGNTVWKNTTRASSGGAIYLGGEGCSLDLNGGLITACSAKGYGGGIYAGEGSDVGIRGARTVKGNWSENNKDNDDIYLVNTKTSKADLVLSDRLTGTKTVGVRYSASSDFGNDAGDYLAVVANGVDQQTVTNSVKAFFNDTDPEGTKAMADAAATNLLWAKREPGDTWNDGDQDVTVRVTKVGKPPHEWIKPEEAFAWIDADALVEVLKDAEFGGDLIVTNGVNVTLVSTNKSPDILSRRSDVLIRVLPGATLVVSNLYIDGNEDLRSSGLIKVDGGTLELRNGTQVRSVWGKSDRASGAISVQNHGTFTMRSGAVIRSNRNDYVNAGNKSGYGGGLLVEDHSTANLLGGKITWCHANRGGGVFIGTESTVNISGDMTISDNGNIGLTSNDDNLCVADLSKLRLVGPLTGEIGYNEGRSGDTNVFGKVAAGFTGDKQASAHNFTHDVTKDIGMAVSDGAETLLVWGNALDENGKYQEGDKTYSLVNGGEPLYEIPVPGVPDDLTYDGTAKTCLTDGAGYRVLAGNVATNVGNYTVVVTTRAGFAWEGGTTGQKEIPWEIKAAEYELKGVTFKDATFEYDGMMKYLALTGTLPDGLSVEYLNNGRWQPGTNDVTAVISGSVPNYKPESFPIRMSANLIIVDPEGKYHGETEPPGPGPEYADPDPIAFMSIARVSESEWELVVTDAVQWCNYSLFATNTLEGGFVITNSAGAFVVDPVTNFQWKSTDKEIKLKVPANGGQRFWRAIGMPGQKQ